MKKLYAVGLTFAVLSGLFLTGAAPAATASAQAPHRQRSTLGATAPAALGGVADPSRKFATDDDNEYACTCTAQCGTTSASRSERACETHEDMAEAVRDATAACGAHIAASCPGGTCQCTCLRTGRGC